MDSVARTQALHAEALHREILTERSRSENVTEVRFDRSQQLDIKQGNRLFGDAVLLVVVSIQDDAARIDIDHFDRMLGNPTSGAIDRRQNGHGSMVGARSSARR